MEFRILGPFEVYDGDRQVGIGGPKQRAVLALLLHHRGQTVSLDRLIDALWADRPPARAEKTLQVYVSNLRKALASDILVTRGNGYALEVDDGALDLARFEGLVDQGRRELAEGDAEAGAAALREALDLWRGPALADLVPEGLLTIEAARMEDMRQAALEERVEADLALGRHARLAPELSELVAANPLREELRRQQMVSLYRSGRQAEALAAYRDARSTLVDELGIEPSRPLQELNEAILHQDPALDLPDAPPGESGPNGRPPSSPALGKPPRRRRPSRRAILAAAAALGGLAVAAALVLPGGESSSQRAGVPPDSIALIDPASNEVTKQIPVGSTPTAIAAGPGGVWALSANEETIARVDPRSGRVIRRIGTRGVPTDIAVAGGAVWVVNRPATVVRIDAGSGVLVRTLPIRLAAPPPRFSIPPSAWLGAASDGVWLSAHATIARIDLRSTRVSLRRRAPFAAGPVAVGEGAVWVGGLARVEPATGELAASIQVPFEPADVAVGGGAVWLARLDSDTVWRIDPRADATQRTISVGRQPSGLAFGEGSLWVASRDGTVSRIDPATNRVVATIRVGGTPLAIAVGAGGVWVTVS